MRFASLEKCREFFNLMMLEHEVKGILEYASLELWTVQVDDRLAGAMTVKVMTGKNGELFIFTPTWLAGGGPVSLAYDAGAQDDNCAELDAAVIEILEKSAANDYVPVGLLTAISDFRADPNEIDTAANFLMTYPEEVEAALKMVQLFA